MHERRNGSDQSRDSVTAHLLKVFGIVLVVASIAWMVLGRAAAVDAPFFILNWHVPAILLGLFLWYRGKQYAARSRPAHDLDDSRAPVVYLRPFRQDASTIGRVLPGLANPALLLSTFSTFEEQLEESLRPVGPFLALAQPGRGLQAPGAARVHARNEDWHQLVDELLRRARLVVLRPGESDALRWELTRAFEIVKPTQLLLLFHNTSRKDYDRSSELLRESAGIPLPQFAGRNAFIAFEEDWRPRFLPIRAPLLRSSKYKPWRSHLNHGLQPVFQALGLPWQPSPLSTLTILSFIFLSLFLLFILALIAAG